MERQELRQGGGVGAAFAPLPSNPTMKDVLVIIGFFVVWIILNKYILPKMGVGT
ncbi:MAG: hypothetical protein HY884_06335 [Deltaproteobacteria bacterium]|nr:hypothetical protein [Deltaproteobacteria bacterium]